MLTEILGILLTARWADSIEANCSLKFSDINYSISTVICPAGCWRQNHELCGTGNYGDGPVCLAGIHAGIISECGGVAKVYETIGFTSSKGSLRYSVRTSTCGPKEKAYTFEMTCNTTGNSEFDITKVVCPSNCQSNYVCGSDFYTSNSSVCAAAIHAGMTGTEGGELKFYKRQGQSSHAGTTNHGIETSTCGSTNISFNFIKINDCLSNPCQNLGTCVDLGIGYVCVCAPDYEGKNCGQKILPTTCASANKDGVQTLSSGDSAYCSNGWRVIQRRTDGSEDFFRNWNDYRQGFGNKSNEFWLGLDLIHTLTTSHSYELRVDMEDFENQTAYAKYSSFRVGSAADNFTLEVGNYSGNAGNSLDIHNGREFSTKDRDRTGSNNCTNRYHGAWWYVSKSWCVSPNLNGEYLARQTSIRGIWWWLWESSYKSLKRVEMKIRLL